MDKVEKEVKRIKQTNYIIFGLFVALLLGVIAAGVIYHYRLIVMVRVLRFISM